MKALLLFLALTLVSVASWAVEKKFDCPSKGWTVVYETAPADPENGYGTLSDDKSTGDGFTLKFVARDTPVQGPAGTSVYFVAGRGGPTQRYYIAIPNQFEKKDKGTNFKLESIVQDGSAKTVQNPYGLKGETVSCVVDQ